VNGQIMELRAARLRTSGSLLRGYLSRLRCAEQRPDPMRAEIGVDIAAAATATIIMLVTVVYVAKVPAPCPGISPVCPNPGMQELGWHLSALPVTAAAWPLALRRLRPLTALWLSLAGAAVIAGGVTPIAWIPVAAAAYSAGVHGPYRRASMLSAAAAGLLAAVMIPAVPAHHMSGVIERGAALLAPAALFAAGNAMRGWRRRAGESQARLLRLQAEHEDATRQAIRDERARIAGELHDVVAHNVSMMVVQAGGARRILGYAPDEARTALLAVEESGRAAIVELQHLLGLLAPPGQPQDTAADPEALRPQPGLDQVRSLIDRVAGAGLPVRLRALGTPRALPAGMDLAAYRVIQEALTNVIKHAGRPPTTVTLDYRRSDLVIEVTDEGRAGSAAAPERIRAPGGAAGTMPGTGRGLLGMRERVALYGGELDARPRAGGGWLVRATIPEPPPLTAAAADSPAAP
jgi:signal transduction histidine kinase